MQRSVLLLMKMHRNFLKMFLTCICGCEVSNINTEAENGYDHISIAVDSVEKTMEKIKAYPVKPINDHWFSLPDGTRIELKLLANWKVND